MSKWPLTVVFALLLNAMTPATAAAQFWDVIKWINDMSGPEMWGVSGDVPIVCSHEDSDPNVFLGCTQFLPGDRGLPTGPRRTWVFSGRVGFFSNNKLFGDDEDVEKAVSGWLLGVGATVPTRIPVGRVLTLDATAAFDFFKFGGPSVPDDFWVPTLSAGVVLRYNGDSRSPLLNGPRVQLRYQQFLDSFGGDRFSAPGSFRSETEGIWQLAFGWTLF